MRSDSPLGSAGWAALAPQPVRASAAALPIAIKPVARLQRFLADIGLLVLSSRQREAIDFSWSGWDDHTRDEQVKC
jgi:hypothetical protein